MKQFKVYRHPGGDVEAVKQGWSWPAFFFIWIWALIKKIWLLGLAVLVGYLVIQFLAAAAGEGVSMLVSVLAIAVNVVFGMNGNAWREKNLLSRGYEMKEIVTAANPEGAIALLLKAPSASQA